MKLYKYVSMNIADKVLLHDGISLKFNYPKNYNDPLELFLTPKGVDDDFVFAYYNHLLGELPQLPTTCFSRRPDILPMWAHYGGDHTGFVLEINEDALSQHFDAGFLQDVEYKSEIGFCDVGALHYAAQTSKPRHTHFARSQAFRSAYFTKNDCWSYELERRLVLDHTHFPDPDGMLVLSFPASCVTSLVAGCRTDEQSQKMLRDTAKRFGCHLHCLRLGKTLQTPYFVGATRKTSVFDGCEIVPADNSCGACGDPIDDERLNCRWCDMTDEDATEAALSDPMRLFAIAGMPDPYGLAFSGIRPVGSKIPSKESP